MAVLALMQLAREADLTREDLGPQRAGHTRGNIGNVGATALTVENVTYPAYVDHSDRPFWMNRQTDILLRVQAAGSLFGYASLTVMIVIPKCHDAQHPAGKQPGNSASGSMS